MADFSEEWKSLFPISSVFSPPSLISSPSLGPLLFTPSPRQTSSLAIPSLQKLLHYTSKDTNVDHTLLPIVPCSSSQFLLFFPTGTALDQLASLHFSLLPNNKLLIISEETMEHQLQNQIKRIYPSLPRRSKITGEDYSLVCVSTWSSVHWFIKWITLSSSSTSAYRGTQHFDHPVQHACWSPHVASTCLVLLQNGDLFLFHLGEEKEQVSKFSIPWHSQHRSSHTNRWLGCDFTCNPRIFVIASSHAVLLINMSESSVVCTVAEYDMDGSTGFIAFCMAGATGCQFVVASDKSLYLFDTRNPREPMLQWSHGLNKPQYLNVFKLSDLRSVSSVEDKYKWATDSGFAIVLGSLMTSTFGLFCYGPPLPPIAGNWFKAWDLPSEISMLGNHWKCNCRDCLLEQDFSESVLSEWRKQRVWGFCVGSSRREDDGMSFEGFTLVRLVSSGKLEAQEFMASFNKLTNNCCRKLRNSSAEEGSVVDLFIDQEYEFVKRFKYLGLDSLDGFMKGDLSRVLESKSKNLIVEPSVYTNGILKHSSDLLGASNMGNVNGVSPLVEDVLKGISWPMSIHEISLSRMWGSLSKDIMQLAFTEKSKLSGVVVNHRKLSSGALEIPDMSHMSSFFLKKPTSQNSKRSCKRKQELGNELVGPVLPLHYLLTLQGWDGNNKDRKKKRKSSSEVSHKYSSNKVMSLSSNEIAAAISKRKEVEPLLLFHKPGAFTVDRVLGEDEDGKMCTLISKMPIRNSKSMKETGMDMFDDTCPIELNFDGPSMSFAPQEIEAYKILKGNMLTWLEKNAHYQEFTAAYFCMT